LKTITSFPKTIFIILFLFLQTIVFGQYPELSSSLISENMRKNADAVVRYDRNELDFSNASKAKFSKDYAITVLKKSGKSHLTFYKGYKEGSDKVKAIKIEILDKNGSLIESYNNKDIEDHASYDGFSMFTDFRFKYLNINSTRYPVTLKYSYTIEKKNTFPGNWYPIQGYNVSVEKSSFHVISKDSDSFSFYPKNLEGLNWETAQKNKFEIASLPAIKAEKYSPGFRDVFPILFVRPSAFKFEGFKGNYSNWNEFATWRHENFLMGRNNLISNVRNHINPLIKDKNDKFEIARLVYEYIQNTTRYVNISLDEGAIQPMYSQEVHDKKYGDCKALSFYMKSILDQYDIDANYIEIHAESDYPVSYEPNFASSTQGNHIILSIPWNGDTAWVDCTSKNLPFNFLGDFTDDRLCLSIDGNGNGEIVRTPTYGFDENQIIDSISVRITKDNTSFEIDRNYIGIPMSNYSDLMDFNEKELSKYIRKQFSNDFTNVEVEGDILCAKNKVNDFQMDLKYNVSSSKLLEHAGKYVLLPLNILDFDMPEVGKSKSRYQDIVFFRSSRYRSHIKVEIPSHLKFSEFEGNMSESSEFAEYQLSLKQKANYLIIEKELKIKKGVYPPEKYSEIQEFFKNVKQNENLQCIFETTQP